MKQGVKLASMGILGILAGAGGAVLATGTPATTTPVTRAEVEKIVREYILANPEILPEAMQNLERKEAAKRVRNSGDKVEQPFASAWEGSADADVTLVEFFDYACGYCKSARVDIDKLLAEDKRVRLVYRELPILGPDSEAAARISLAVAKMGGNYQAFHRALFAQGRPTPDAVTAALAASGVDPKQARALANSSEISNEISGNIALQRSLGLSGTPSWVVGDQLIGGAVGYDELKAAIAETRTGKPAT